MNLDFHYYGTYSAAILAGYTHKEAQEIAYYAQFVDECSESLLKERQEINWDPLCVTVNSDKELNWQFVNPAKYTREELIKIGGLWSAFHFLPGRTDIPYNREDLRGEEHRRICLPNSPLVAKMVEHTKRDGSIPAIGMAMHVLADTWAHSYFVGMPTKYVNDIEGDVYEVTDQELKIITLRTKLGEDRLEDNVYAQMPENLLRERGICYLGHARVGHLPDYSFIKYMYKPVWKNGEEVIKDNPTEYMNAFCQMIRAMQYIRGDVDTFNVGEYAKLGNATEIAVNKILTTRKLNTEDEWKTFICDWLPMEAGQAQSIEEFDKYKCVREYEAAEDKNNTSLNQFLTAARRHRIFVEEEAKPYPF